MKRKVPPRSSSYKFKELEDQFYKSNDRDIFKNYYDLLPVDAENEDIEDLENYIEYLYEH